MASFKQQTTEVIYLLISMQEKLNPKQFDLETYNEYEDLLKRVHGGEKATQVAYFVFLKAKKMVMQGPAYQQLALDEM